ncbi:MAG: hypothetical protein HY298_20220 [Verrucomicrobia bacterium]|nr:hypothetical protein [Verrucomicrobiota bacterium]
MNRAASKNQIANIKAWVWLRAGPLLLLALSAVSAQDKPPGVRVEGDRIVLATSQMVYAVATNGYNQAFQDRQTGKNYLDAADPGHFMSIEKNGQRLGSTSVEFAGGFLQVKFGGSGIWAKIHVRVLPHYATLELTAVNDHTISSFHLADLPLTLTKYVSRSIASCRDDDYAAAVIPLNLETHASPEGGRRAVLSALADRRVRLEGAKIAILGSPTKDLLARIEQVETENGLPHPMLGGVWARKSVEQKKSYLFVDLSEATADAMIDYAKGGGFGYIVVYDGVWNGAHGTYPIPVNRKNFPSGEAGLKTVSHKIHTAGLKFGAHILGQDIDKNSPLVHPVPDPGLYVYPDRRRILGTNIGPDDTFIPTTESPVGLLSKADKALYFYGRDLRINDEIVVYEDLQTAPPYGFTGCQRGAHGTLAAAHRAGSPIDNLAQMVSGYQADWRGDLYDRIASAEAAALDQFQFDFLYPDGSGATPGYPLPAWYLSNLIFSKLYHYTRREVLFGLAPPTAYTWHIFTRGNTVDFVKSGMIQYFDRVSVAGARNSAADLQPFEFGWFGYFRHALDGAATRLREMQYAWSKALAYGAAMSLETKQAALDGNGRTQEIFATIKNWEQLKLNDYFPERIREQLKAPGKEFVLDRAVDASWRILPVTYSPEKHVTAVEGGKNVWTLENAYRDQSLRVSIEARPTLTRYGDLANVVLLEPGPLKLNTSATGPLGSPDRQTTGLEYRLKTSAQESPGEKTSFEVAALNKGSNAAGWGCAEVIFDTPKDLSHHRALATWVEGDGSGAYLHFILEDSSRWEARDYYVRLDFKGWKYIEMPESAKGEVYDFAFPFSHYEAIRSIKFAEISRVYVFLSNLPSGAAVTAHFSRLEALRETPQTLDNPGLRVNGESINFPVQLETNWYLEYEGNGKARVFDENGFTKGEVLPVGKAPIIRQRVNEVVFFCSRDQRFGQRSKVTFMTRGEPLQ